MKAYCIYGMLPKELEEIAYRYRINDKDLVDCELKEDPHITIMYGPLIDDNTDELNEYSSPDELNKLLGGFVSNYNNQLPNIKFTGVGYFDRDKVNIVKLEFESQDLTDMQVYLRKNTHNNYEDMNKINPYDQSYNMPPIKWCHVTLGYLKKDIDVDSIVHKLSKNLTTYIGNEFQLKQIDLITAKTDSSIKLW